MYISNKFILERPGQDYTDAALMIPEMFNRSDSQECSGASKYIYDLYNLGYAFFSIRTIMEKGPDTIPHDFLLRREVAQARRNVLACTLGS